MNATLAEQDVPDGDFELFHLKLDPKTTGLSMTVWIGPRGARHDVRVKVTPADDARAGDLAIMSVRPEPALLHGELPSEDMALVARWIELNESAIVDHWDGITDSVDLARALRPLEPER